MIKNYEFLTFSSHPPPRINGYGQFTEFGPLRVGFGSLGVNFELLGVNFGHLEVNFRPLKVDSTKPRLVLEALCHYGQPFFFFIYFSAIKTPGGRQILLDIAFCVLFKADYGTLLYLMYQAFFSFLFLKKRFFFFLFKVM